MGRRTEMTDLRVLAVLALVVCLAANLVLLAVPLGRPALYTAAPVIDVGHQGLPPARAVPAAIGFDGPSADRSGASGSLLQVNPGATPADRDMVFPMPGASRDLGAAGMDHLALGPVADPVPGRGGRNSVPAPAETVHGTDRHSDVAEETAPEPTDSLGSCSESPSNDGQPAGAFVAQHALTQTADASTLVRSRSAPQTIYVDDDFEDDPANHKWNTIQEGVNDAASGDNVYVYSGTYVENVQVDKDLTVCGENRAAVVLDGGGMGTCVYLSDGASVSISELTIRNARDEGLYSDGCSLNLADATITGCGDYAVYSDDGNSPGGLTLRGCTIENNGGGVCWGSYGYRATGDAVIDGSTISSNAGHGLELYLADGMSATITN
ncbi:MAG: hypothetical protein DRI39_08600, partial [Chloroflexi bacterium]